MWDFIKKIVGTKNDREIKRIRPFVEEINQLEPEYQRLNDDELKAKTEQFKSRLGEATATLKSELEETQNRASVADPEEREELKTQAEELDKELRQKEAELLDQLLPEAFAAVREPPVRRFLEPVNNRDPHSS